MAEEQFQIPIHYRIEIGEEFPEQRENPNTPCWEALVEIPDEVQRTVKAKNLSLQWHAMELARTAIGKLTLINDPQFTPHARLAEKVHFDAVHRTYSAVDFTFPYGRNHTPGMATEARSKRCGQLLVFCIGHTVHSVRLPHESPTQ